MFGAITETQPRIDKLQLAGVALLMAIGGLFIYSATMVTDSAATAAFFSQTWVRQMIWYAVGIGACGAICLVDYRVVARWSLIIYVISILSLIVVLIPGIG